MPYGLASGVGIGRTTFAFVAPAWLQNPASPRVAAKTRPTIAPTVMSSRMADFIAQPT